MQICFFSKKAGVKHVRTFASAESGAVTVDWVVLTAAMVGLGLAAVSQVSVGANALGSQVETALSEASIAGLSPDEESVFAFLQLSEAQQTQYLDVLRQQANATIRRASRDTSASFLEAIASENFADAQMWMERRHIAQIVLDEKGLSPFEAISVSEMQQILADAQGG